MNSSSIAEQQELVKESLFQFVRKHIPSAQLSFIDEIVLSYVVSILEELGTESSVEDAFDVEGFCEMLEAYFPQFSAIGHVAVCQWMFQLEETLRQSKCSGKDDSDICQLFRQDLSLATPPPRTSSESESSNPDVPNKRIHQLSETSDGSSDSSGEYSGQESAVFTERCSLLQEMFPLSCGLEVRHCLAVAEGDVGRAVQLVLHRQDAGLALHAGSTLPAAGKPVANDEELKNRIINRYSYVDKDDDVREHRPVGPKVVPKKLVRYRDNKIVSLKGERFTDVKKEEDEEMKKTYVSIKPAKQYRFH